MDPSNELVSRPMRRSRRGFRHGGTLTTLPTRWAAELDSTADQDFHSITILLVEDDPDTRANLVDILEGDHYRVVTASSVRESLKRDDWNEISIVILDRRLPDGDAVALLPDMRRRSPDCAVIVITGLSDFDGAVAALRHGVTDYLLKPIHPDALRQTLRQIAAKQHVERALAKSQLQLRQERDFIEILLETAPTIVVLVNPRGRIVRFNTQFAELTGWRPEEVTGRSAVRTFFSNEERRRVKPVLRSLLWHEQIHGVVSRIRESDSRECDIRWSAKVLRDAQGQVIGILASGQDVSELKQAQDRALQSERLAAIGEAMAGLVHESRNALQRCQACLEMLSLEVADRPGALDLVQRIRVAQNDLHQLFEEVREYAAPIRLNLERCVLSVIWRQAWRDLEREHRSKGVRLSEDAPASDLVGEADPFSLGQVLRNILENAIEASPVGGEIRLTCRETDFAGQRGVRITVDDQGPGFPVELRASVFEPFFTTKSKGTGLGLAIARRIVDAHGGRISISDNIPSGGGVEILLPLKSP